MWQIILIHLIYGLMVPLVLVSSAVFADIGATPEVNERRDLVPGAIDWTTIKELDLKTAAKIALAGNPTLEAAEARVQQAMHRVNQAKADYWPRLDLTASGTRIWLSEEDLTTNRAMARVLNPAATVDDPEDRFRTGVIASWKVFDGFARKFANASAHYGQDQSKAALNDSRRLMLSSVATAYFAAQLIRENMDIAIADEVFNQRQLADAKARLGVGTGSLSDALNFEIRINDARAARIKAQRNYEAAVYALAALMGLPKADLPSTVKLAPLKNETINELATPDAEVLISYAHTHRPDIRQSTVAVLQAAAEVGVARSRFYPNLNLSAGYEGTHMDNFQLEEEDYGATVGLRLSFNLFTGGADRARIKEARARVAELEKSLENLKITASSEVRDSLTQLLSAQQQLHLQRINAELVKKNRDLVNKEYTAGQASLVRLNEAQRDLVAAQSRLALALASLRQAWFNLETDTGRILERLDDTSSGGRS